MMRINILIICHGSRFDTASKEAGKIVKSLQNINKYGRVLIGFIGFNEPDVFATLDELTADSPDHIVIVPLILFEGKHAATDISQALQYGKSKYPQINFIATKIIGSGAALLPIVYDNIASVLGPLKIKDDEAVILLVFRGSSSQNVLEESNAIMAQVRKRYPYLYGSYMEINSPGIYDGLLMAQEGAVKYGKKHIIIIPYLLFGGILLNKIHEMADRAVNAGITLSVVQHLGISSKFPGIILNTIDETVKKEIYKEVD